MVTTVSAVIIAATNGSVAPESFESPSPWTLASLGFIVVMMGWMPAPIEISSITSLWLKSQSKKQKVTIKSALFDFNIGYITTAFLAIIFLALGALVLHGNGEVLKQSGIGFSQQLVSMYANTIGEWSRYLIAIIAFFCIFGSAITVIDGYARAIAESQLLLQKKPLDNLRYHNAWIVIISICAMCILIFFTSSLMAMLNFAMLLAFLTTPVFALLNYALVNRSNLPEKLKFGRALNVLSWVGLLYLFGFLGLFVWWKWLA